VDHGTDFSSNSDLTSNGTNQFVSSGGIVVARLVDESMHNENGGFFTTSRLGVDNFTTTFTFQFGGSATADGMCFVIQGVNPTQLITGEGGGGLGYGPDRPGGGPGIPNSIAIKFDLFQNVSEGPDSTGLFLNGDSPTVPSGPGDVLVDLRGTGIDLHSGDVFQVTLTYDGTTLTETILDTVTNVSFTTAYTVDIPGQVGGNVAYAGFTAGTGGSTTIADVQNWLYQFNEPSFGPSPHTGGTGGGLGSVLLSGITGTPNSLFGTPTAGISPAPASGNLGRGLADVLLSDPGSRPDWSQGTHQLLASGSGGDLATHLLGQAFDPHALDAVFSRI
jgi:hypothetical protein